MVFSRVPKVVTMSVAVYWDTTPRSPYVNRRLQGIYHLHLQSRENSRTRKQHSAGDIIRNYRCASLKSYIFLSLIHMCLRQLTSGECYRVSLSRDICSPKHRAYEREYATFRSTTPTYSRNQQIRTYSPQICAHHDGKMYCDVNSHLHRGQKAYLCKVYPYMSLADFKRVHKQNNTADASTIYSDRP
jgi:hypothetical protein